ncbi:hypothetical protein CA13_10080 [Planctomycetes bacterium CA13]|uniref:Uncharacterized protein n=1 Tax=Novipirellula herctigrandis TaxID=2527986 RepID=A0A5C5YX44_9BACT|nr:hypothetical protein CA13_10080 [Planctomycetes bacterium CA13]
MNIKHWSPSHREGVFWMAVLLLAVVLLLMLTQKVAGLLLG